MEVKGILEGMEYMAGGGKQVESAARVSDKQIFFYSSES